MGEHKFRVGDVVEWRGLDGGAWRQDKVQDVDDNVIMLAGAGLWLLSEPGEIRLVSRAEQAPSPGVEMTSDKAMQLYAEHRGRVFGIGEPASTYAEADPAVLVNQIDQLENMGAISHADAMRQRMKLTFPQGVPDVEEFLAYKDPKTLELDSKESADLVVSLMGQLDAERQRASGLGDKAGKAEKDLAEWQSMFGDIKRREVDLKSTIRSKDRQIAALKAKLLLLNRTCR